MALKRLIVGALLAAVIAYALLVVMMTPSRPTSGSGEGDVVPTQAP